MRKQKNMQKGGLFSVRHVKYIFRENAVFQEKVRKGVFF